VSQLKHTSTTLVSHLKQTSTTLVSQFYSRGPPRRERVPLCLARSKFTTLLQVFTTLTSVYNTCKCLQHFYKAANLQHFYEAAGDPDLHRSARLIDFEYHSTLGLRVIQKKKSSARRQRVPLRLARYTFITLIIIVFITFWYKTCRRV